METNLPPSFSNIKLADVCMFLPHAAKSLMKCLGQSYRYLLPFEISLCFPLHFELLLDWYFLPTG